MARGVRAWAWCLALALAACDNPYHGDPTPCDDWCLAAQRNDCPDDYPEKCVSECEGRAGPTTYPECSDEWHERLACYQRAPDTDFYCVEGESRRKSGVCEVEEARFWTCTGSNACLYLCLAQVSACEDFDRKNCEDCVDWPPECEDETARYVECLFYEGLPDCSWFEKPAPGCSAEGEAVFECLGR